MKKITVYGYTYLAPDETCVGDEVLLPAPWWARDIDGGDNKNNVTSWSVVTQLGGDYDGPLVTVLQVRKPKAKKTKKTKTTKAKKRKKSA